MAQLQWTVPGYGGRNYRVGMYHGEDSGHLMVHCNNKVMLIDFGVKDSKNYSFFLDEELFELHLTRENGRFSYELKHNEDIDSPHNRRRDQEKKTGRWRMIAAGVVLVFFAIVLLAAWSNSPVERQELVDALALGAGQQTEVSLFVKNQRWHATYRVDDQIKQVEVPSTHPIKVKQLDLRAGHRFAARYHNEQTDVLYIDWNAPAEETLAEFMRQAMVYHASVHPELSPQQIGCQVRLVYEIEGMSGLGTLMGQKRTDAPKHNLRDYLKLTRSSAFRQGNLNCL